MTVNLVIQADVIDIQSDVPRAEDIFFVDTNVWLWYAYPNAIASARSDSQKRSTETRIRQYTGYLDQTFIHQAQLKYSGLILAELAHVIEKTECAIHNKNKRISLDTKTYRHNYPDERRAVISTIQLVWSQVKMAATSVDSLIDQRTTDKVLQRMGSEALDGYDLLMLEAMSRSSLEPVKVITADMDYAVVPGIQVFTSHAFVLEQASLQGKLLTR